MVSTYKVDDSVIDVVYDPINGQVYPDGLIDKYCDTVEKMGKYRCDNSDIRYKIITGSHLVLDELRARMVEGRLKIRNLVYWPKNQEAVEIPMSDDARFDDYLPEGFCDYNENSLMRILYGKPKT